LNALSEDVYEELITGVADASSDPGVRVIVVTGAGRAFSAGGDLGAIEQMGTDRRLRNRVMDASRTLFNLVASTATPVVAAVNGPAVGAGCTLALMSDIVVMSSDTYLAEPHVRIGLVGGDGSTTLWPLLAGLPAARFYLLTGERIPAEEAYRIGLVHSLSAPGDALAEATAIAAKIAALPKGAVEATRLSLGHFVTAAAGGAFELARSAEHHAFDSAEHREILEALRSARTHE
jgi:enoyl-CoA hydratase